MKPLPRREFLRISGAALATTGAGSSIAGAAASDDSRLASESVCIGTIGPGAVYLLNGLYDGGFAQLMAELTTATRSRKRHKVDRREIAAVPGISQIPLL